MLGTVLTYYRPSTTEQTELLVRESEVHKKSDETAWTILDSEASFSVRHPGSRTSLESSETIRVTFDFESQWLSGRVYVRSYKYIAEKLTKRRGKDVIRDPRANLFIGSGIDDKDSDQASVISIPRSTSRNVVETSKSDTNYEPIFFAGAKFDALNSLMPWPAISYYETSAWPYTEDYRLSAHDSRGTSNLNAETWSQPLRTLSTS